MDYYGDLFARGSSEGFGRVGSALEAAGVAVIRAVAAPDECRGLVELFVRDELFRRTIDLEAYQYGRGRYRFFEGVLPPLLADLRRALYQVLVPIARRWGEAAQASASYPETLDSFLAEGEAEGQTLETTLLFRYEVGGFNVLHQDLYGGRMFPLQACLLLSRPADDFDGGEFLFEERPEGASSMRCVQVELGQGDLAIFASNDRPIHGSSGLEGRGVKPRVLCRHGVGRVTRGVRYAVGLTFARAPFDYQD
ncbi:MAG: 2OG-Fe(II) oxygenase [Deltaproteobacteria bacterium]|nr:2OG-Fe(II) oxygenase [Deltaproteobacteria bacterium]